MKKEKRKGRKRGKAIEKKEKKKKKCGRRKNVEVQNVERSQPTKMRKGKRVGP